MSSVTFSKIFGVFSAFVFWCIFIPLGIYGWLRHYKQRNSFIFNKRYGICSLILSVHYYYLLLFAGLWNLLRSNLFDINIDSAQRVFYVYVYVFQKYI